MRKVFEHILFYQDSNLDSWPNCARVFKVIVRGYQLLVHFSQHNVIVSDVFRAQAPLYTSLYNNFFYTGCPWKKETQVFGYITQ